VHFFDREVKGFHLPSVPFPKFQSLRPKDFGTSETMRTLGKLLNLGVLYVLEIPKIAGGNVVGIAKTHL
jgi:hypothetical protein